MSQGQVCTEARSRGQSNHKAPHTHLVYSTVQPRPQHRPFGLPLPGRVREPPGFLPRWAPASHACTPPGQAVRIPRSICLLSCCGTGSFPIGAPACLLLGALPRPLLGMLTALASQPPSWAALGESKARPLLSSSQPPSAPRWAGTAPCLPASTKHCSPQGPRGGAHSRLTAQGTNAGSGKGREPGPPQDPEHHLSRIPPAQKLTSERAGLSPTRCS